MQGESDSSGEGNNSAKTKRVFIIDEHPVTRRGIAGIIAGESGMSVCGDAGTFRDAREGVARWHPDLVVSGVRMNLGDALEFISEMKQCLPGVPVLVVSMLDELIYAKRCLDAGASGFVPKTVSAEELLGAMHEVLMGTVWVSPEVTQHLLMSECGASRGRSGGDGVDLLSNRELQVFRLAGGGMPTRAIAEALGISPRTVESHKEHIKDKLRLRTATELSTRAAVWLDGQA